jgi:hypothetical protein
VTAAVLTFLLERTRKRWLANDKSYLRNLALIVLVASATALISALTWWTWNRVATDVHLLFGLSPCVWMALLFGGATAASLICVLTALGLLIRHLMSTSRASKSKP